MDNNIQIFKNAEFGNVRLVEIDNEPWFVGKDVAEILGYSNTNKAIQVHVDNEDKFIRSARGSEMGKLFNSLKEMQKKARQTRQLVYQRIRRLFSGIRFQTPLSKEVQTLGN